MEKKDIGLLTGIKKSWLQMGVELEGSWTGPGGRATVVNQVRGAQVVRDDSVHIGHGDPGEIITRPHANLEELCREIEILYPEAVHPTCGFHIHTSFTPITGSIIASTAFYQFFKDSWNRWGKEQKLSSSHEFWARLSGQNKNTRDEFNPEVQLKGDGRGKGAKGSHARYTILNFYSWEVHKTVECRLLPMFADKEMAIKAIKHLAWIYDSYISEHGFKEIVIEAKNQIRGETAVETHNSYIPSLEPINFEAKSEFPALATGEGVFYALPDTDEVLPFKKLSEKQIP